MIFKAHIPGVLKLAILATLGITVLSCAGPKIKVPPPEPFIGTVDVEALKDHRVLHDVTSFKSEVKVKIMRGKKNLGTFKGALIFNSPDNFRMRVYSPFGSVGVDIIHANGLVQAYVPEQNVLYEGSSPATKAELNFRMDENDKSYNLMALIPKRWGTRIYATYSFEKKALQNRNMTIYEDGEKFAKMQFRDYIGGVPLRARVDMMSGYVLYIYLQLPETGVELDPELFEPFSHDGVEVLPLKRILTEGR